MSGEKIWKVRQGEEGFPEALRQVPGPPRCLYVIGRLPDMRRPRVAVVGARACSDYGKAMARTIGRTLARAKVQVVSGMAYGVDSLAQEGALAEGGETFAVLGCGVDVCYPRSSQELYRRILSSGGVISEFPPGTEPATWTFPTRNRLISGLADAVIVVEARIRSGSLITAEHALAQGRDIYAVPGRITDPLSAGTNRLIRDGAHPLVSMEDLLKDLSLRPAFQTQNRELSKFSLEKEETMVYSVLDCVPKDLEQLLERTGLELPALMRILLRLHGLGLAEESFKNYWRRSEDLREA